ncbi:MAG: helix-turn-helix transcriptional regulator [Clostridia bacterium]|nr:helix-turn-helix transcriptional regulator [Clostridia bacterium]
MIDMKVFGDKLRHHRKNLGLTQEEVATRIGVSAQAVSKWEIGECLPDVFNLKELGDLYGISLDILLETERAGDIGQVAARIEQIADEYVWTSAAKADRNQPYIHHDLGRDLWEMWKGIYFVEAGNKDMQARDKEMGNLRICSPYAMKVWDEDGVVCVVRSDLSAKAATLGEREYCLLRELTSPEGIKLISLLHPVNLTPKAALVEASGIPLPRLGELLLLFTENKIVEFGFNGGGYDGYKLCGHFGIAASMILAAGHLLAKPCYTVSEYVEHTRI